MIATAIPAVKSLENSAINSTVSSTPLESMAASRTGMQKLLASDGAARNWFGQSVSLAGDTALIGADNKAYVFTRTGTTWTQQAKLPVGGPVSLSGDTALIGADGGDSAYVFTRTGTTWTQQQKLTASDGATGDYFGCSVSLSGNTALIGAYQRYGPTGRPGYAYVFTRTGTTWTQQQKLTASDSTNDFGVSVSLLGDTALIGTSKESAYVFTRTGTTWTQQQKLLAADGEEGDGFGDSVSLSGDTALIGASDDNDNGGDGSGSTYVFTRTGTTWTQQAKLLASDGAEMDYFGNSVSLSGDTALIGAEDDDDIAAGMAGSAYVFTRTGTTWAQKLKIHAVDGEASNEFGCSVSLSGDTALIGAEDDDDNGEFSGSAYVFTGVSLDQLPTSPTITGPATGKVGTAYEYNFMAKDFDGDEVYYFIDWGDGTNSGWVGPYASGVTVSAKHTWTGTWTHTFQIKAKARDIYGADSDWGYLPVYMPVNYQSTPQSKTAQQSVTTPTNTPTTTTTTATSTATTSKSLISLLASR